MARFASSRHRVIWLIWAWMRRAPPHIGGSGGGGSSGIGGGCGSPNAASAADMAP
jgi:hypothetical protein